jgi:predicted DNA-binding protein with PD1-like motif
MKYREVLKDAGERILIVVLDPEEEVIKTISAFARDQGLTAAGLTAIGAFRSATVGWFDFAERDYRKIPIDEQCEVLTILGDIAVADDGGTSLHMHCVLGLRDGTTRGGHLLSGYVHPTLEVMITETPAVLRRTARPELGIALIDPEQE